MKTKIRFKIGDSCRCNHPYAYRGTDPFIIVGISKPFLSTNNILQDAYIVMYDDKMYDAIPIENEGGYEMEKMMER